MRASPAPIPPAMKRAWMLLGISIGWMLAGSILYGIPKVRAFADSGLVLRVLTPAVMFGPAAAAWGVSWRRERELRRGWRISGGRQCTACGHDLRTLGDSGRCPECGAAFDIERDRAAWRQAGLK